MSEYHKIQSVFLRDPQTKHKTFLEGQFALPEFEYLQRNKWEFTEKVDGTNIRISFDNEGVGFGGRTDAAQIPAKLVEHLNRKFNTPAMLESLKSIFEDGAVLYGEGFGAGIQKGGGNYGAGQSFVLFDVKVGDWWLKREDVEEIGVRLGVPVVPIIGVGTLHDGIWMCKNGFDSKWGPFEAEGIVARPATELKTRSGHRVITKIKCRDFPRA